MLDIKFIRENPEKVKEGLKKRGANIDIDQLLELDKKRRDAIQAVEDIAAKKNKSSKDIVATANEQEKRKIILEMKEMDKNDDRLNKRMKELEEEFKEKMLKIPNLPFDNVPCGKDETENKVLREVGKKPEFKFQPKDYMEIAENLDLIDVKRAAKISGTRFAFLKNEMVFLEFGLINLAFNLLVKEGFVPVITPVMLKSEIARGMGYFEQADAKEAYYLPADDMYLIGTAEQSLGTMHAGEVFEEKDLPRRYLGFSSCYRREAGSHGKDTKGILRVHQFDKVEMFSFSLPEKSIEEHKFLLSMQEKLMKELKLPYRVVHLCIGDTGLPSASTYDIETWIPGEEKYRETHSTSNCTDFQARRLNIRYKNEKTGKPEFVHTLNGTAFAVGRIMIAIIENYQQKDGSIKVPDALKKYVNFKEIK